MKITKYGQSCVLIETKGRRILIDPGDYEFKESFLEKDWINIDAILITHMHGDHCHDPAIRTIMKNPKTKLYGSKETASKHSDLSFQIVKVGDILNIEGIKVEVVNAVHGYNPILTKFNAIVNGGVGYIVDDGAKRAYATSDTIFFPNDYKCDVIFVPVNNHGLTFDPHTAVIYSKHVGAKLVIPVHYHSPTFPADMELVKKEFDAAGFKYKILDIGESIEVS